MDDDRPEANLNLRLGQHVRLKTGPTSLTGIVVGFTRKNGVRHALVEWLDRRIMPNPSMEELSRLEIVPAEGQHHGKEST